MNGGPPTDGPPSRMKTHSRDCGPPDHANRFALHDYHQLADLHFPVFVLDSPVIDTRNHQLGVARDEVPFLVAGGAVGDGDLIVYNLAHFVTIESKYPYDAPGWQVGEVNGPCPIPGPIGINATFEPPVAVSAVNPVWIRIDINPDPRTFDIIPVVGSEGRPSPNIS